MRRLDEDEGDEEEETSEDRGGGRAARYLCASDEGQSMPMARETRGCLIDLVWGAPPSSALGGSPHRK